MTAPRVKLYTRSGCHLCEEAEAMLVRHGLRPELVDIDADPELRQRYTECVPVVEIDGKERFRGRVNDVLLKRILAGKADERVQTLLGMFAKYWVPGRVKTRLAAAIGPDCATRVHQALVETLVARFQAVAERRTLCFAPAEAATGFSALAADTWDLVPQADGDLGARMQAFFEAALKQVERVVLIGSDSPDLPAEYVERAFESLRTHEVVLGPAADGGYYLVGAARRVPPIFAGIDWSTAAVFTQTVERLQAAQIAWHELPGWYDVDEEPALQLLLRNLALADIGDPQLARLRERLQALLNDRQTV